MLRHAPVAVLGRRVPERSRGHGKAHEKPIFSDTPKFRLPDLIELWAASPLSGRGRTKEAYGQVREILKCSVDWLRSRDSFLLEEIVRCVAVFDSAVFMRPTESLHLKAEAPDQRAWTILRWAVPQVAVAILEGTNPMQSSIPIENFPEDLRPLGKGKEPHFAVLTIPGGTFPRFEIWYAKRGFRGEENPWFATHFLASSLAKLPKVREQMSQFVAIRDQRFTDEDTDSWFKAIHAALPDLDLALADVEANRLIEKADLLRFLKHFFPFSPRK